MPARTLIVHKTFSDTHMWNTGPRALGKREQLRMHTEAFIAEYLNEKDVICITESAGQYASSVTVWYRET